jgi:hypothetical protein
MFVSKRGLVVVATLVLAAGCTAADIGEGSSDTPHGIGAGAAGGDGAGTSVEGASSSSGANGAGGGGGGGDVGASSGGSSSGGVTPGPTASFTCTRCSTYAADQAAAGALGSWKMCNGELVDGLGNAPKSYELYTSYLGCLCSGPCANECGSSLCALVPTNATLSCKSCLALQNAACSAPKSACLADQ